MNIVTLTPDFSASPQIAPADVAEIAALGFRSILCNRPDDEDPGQTPFDEIDAAAVRTRPRQRARPGRSPARSRAEDVENFRAALAELPRPVLAYCRSGTRCQNLWRLAS